MRVFYLSRLFSGLESSFISRKWSPTGVPTIYRIIEEFDKKHDACFTFTVKDSGTGYFTSWHGKTDQDILINGLHHHVVVISGIDFFPLWIGRKIRMILREVRQTLLILYKIYKFRPDVLYCDHSNVIIAAIFSRMKINIPVVFRVMGVNQFMRTSLASKKIRYSLYRWAYKSPFSLVICTQDGSDVEKWTNQALLPNVRREILLNGVDPLSAVDNVDSRLDVLPSDKIIIMYVGKIEVYKGCYEFVQSILNLIACNVLNIHALIIGSGTEDSKVKSIVNGSNAGGFFTFIKSLPHNQVFHAHNKCNIYVSINHFGNLSNANLEAIQSNDCMIISEYQKGYGINKITELLLKDSVISVPINQPTKLASVLLTLIKSKKKREAMSQRVKEVKKAFIYSWGDRIKVEMDLLENLTGGVN